MLSHAFPCLILRTVLSLMKMSHPSLQLSSHRKMFEKQQGKIMFFPSVIRFMTVSWPEDNSITRGSRLYFNIRDNLSLFKSTLFKMDKLVAPASLRNQIINIGYEMHQDISWAVSTIRVLLLATYKLAPKDQSPTLHRLTCHWQESQDRTCSVATCRVSPSNHGLNLE